MVLKRRRDHAKMWKELFKVCFIVIISGLLYLILTVTSEPVCYTLVSLDESYKYMKKVDCNGSNNVCHLFASSEDLNLFDLLDSPCGYQEDHPFTHDNPYKVITCQDVHLPTVNAGYFNCSGYSIGSKCNLTCDDGYYPSATKYTVCEEYGDYKAYWTVGEFQCSFITCQDVHIPTVNAGFFDCSGYSVGRKCNLICDDGYYPSATKYLVCKQYDDHKANWTVGEFQCSAIKCSTTNLPTVSNGSFDCTYNSNVSVGKVCNLTCTDELYPAHSRQAKCVAGTSNQGGVWSNGSFVCQLLSCNDWIAWNGSEYKYNSLKQSWDASRQFCESVNSRLVTIENKEENDFVHKIAQHCEKSGSLTWIGLNDRNSEGTWEWSDGTISAYKNWYKDQPDGGDEENCVCLDGYTREWYDWLCTEGVTYAICEKTILLHK